MVARLAGLEPATLGLEGRCSIQLSYKRLVGVEGLTLYSPLSKQKRYQIAQIALSTDRFEKAAGRTIKPWNSTEIYLKGQSRTCYSLVRDPFFTISEALTDKSNGFHDPPRP